MSDKPPIGPSTDLYTIHGGHDAVTVALFCPSHHTLHFVDIEDIEVIVYALVEALAQAAYRIAELEDAAGAAHRICISELLTDAWASDFRAVAKTFVQCRSASRAL